MRYEEVQKMEREQIAYHLLMFRMTLYKEKLDKVTLYRKKNAKGRLISNIICYMTDNNGNLHSERYRLFDDEYLWFTCALNQDFPAVEFEDLTADADKLVKNADVAAGDKELKDAV